MFYASRGSEALSPPPLISVFEGYYFGAEEFSWCPGD